MLWIAIRCRHRQWLNCPKWLKVSATSVMAFQPLKKDYSHQRWSSWDGIGYPCRSVDQRLSNRQYRVVDVGSEAAHYASIIFRSLNEKAYVTACHVTFRRAYARLRSSETWRKVCKSKCACWNGKSRKLLNYIFGEVTEREDFQLARTDKLFLSILSTWLPFERYWADSLDMFSEPHARFRTTWYHEGVVAWPEAVLSRQ